MTQGDDPLLRALANLRPMMPDPKWEQRVRVRCHAELAGRLSKARIGERRPLLRFGLIDAVAFALLCAYLTVFLSEAARLGGLQ
ncbi:MAG TPA: hypothetical protein VGK29_21690 [Paludibaculum sp.]